MKNFSQIRTPNLEEAKYTNVHNKIKNIKNLSRKEAEFIANIDPAVMGQVVKVLMPMFEEVQYVSEEQAQQRFVFDTSMQMKKGEKLAKKFDLKSSWAVCQFESDYNPIHWHDGHLSGVMYTKMPKDLGSSYKDQNKNGKIAFIHGSTQLLVSSVYDVKPEVGDLFIFPSYMMHTVYPFFSDEERRSVSFNAFIDEKAAKF